jgi:glycosyltransferase involved in cell wall biosynthesis
MKLSIIIPVHNEENYIGEVLERIFALQLFCEKEIVVVNDGSTDNTSKILEKLSEVNNFKLLKHEKNLGKGQAIKTGLGECTGDLIIIQDADLEYNSNDIPLLLNKMSSDISAVYGKRGSKRWPKRGYYYIIGAKILTITINILFGGKLTDTYTGYKLFNVSRIGIDLLKNLKSTGFEFEAEVTCKILAQSGKIVEVPINYIPRSKNEGKHIGLKDVFKGLFIILEYYFIKIKQKP